MRRMLESDRERLKALIIINKERNIEKNGIGIKKEHKICSKTTNIK